MSTKDCDPVPLILEQFFWAANAARRFKDTPNEKRFRGIGKHLESELKKYLIK